uniref:Secreted protein n=1 Tax=Cacopsylla melanoneura TaxID=428564 RepID=A0A8D9EX00_9HEMI
MARFFPILLLVTSLHTMIKANQSHTILNPPTSHTLQESNILKLYEIQRSHESHTLQEPHTLKPHASRLRVSGKRSKPGRPRTRNAISGNRSKPGRPRNRNAMRAHKSRLSNESDTLEGHKSHKSNQSHSPKEHKSRKLKAHESRNSNESHSLQLHKSHALKAHKLQALNESHTSHKIEILRANQSHCGNESDYDVDNCDYVNSDKFEMDFITSWNESDPKDYHDLLNTTHEYYSEFESPLQTILQNKSRAFNQTFPGVDQDPTSYDRKLYKMHNEYLDHLLVLLDRLKDEGHRFPDRMDLVANEAMKFWHTNTSHIHNATALANLDKVPLPIETIDAVSERALADKANRLFRKLEGKEKGWETHTLNPNITLDPEWGPLNSDEEPRSRYGLTYSEEYPNSNESMSNSMYDSVETWGSSEERLVKKLEELRRKTPTKDRRRLAQKKNIFPKLSCCRSRCFLHEANAWEMHGIRSADDSCSGHHVNQRQ